MTLRHAPMSWGSSSLKTGRSWRIAALAALLTALVVSMPRAGEATGPTSGLRRLAVVAGSNDGGPGRVRLRFANSDALSMAAVLQGFGGVQGQDLWRVSDATAATLRQAIAQAGAAAAAARLGLHQRGQQRVEVVLYYSGHSDEEGLLPAGELVRYAELRSALAALQVDVRIAILDSCASGALIRGKGGVRRPPFLYDQSSQVRGHAYLTSASADEAAQESDRIGASYFTHHLVTGLRGAADVDRDRRVTLSEAYQYAFHATLDTTQKSMRGPQHPNYDFELAGSGDVVITDLTVAGAMLVLDRGAAGRFFVRDAGGRLVAELDKVPGRSIELGLDPGRYRVELRRDQRVWEVEIAVQEGKRSVVDIAAMRPVALAQTRARGGESGTQAGLESAWTRRSALVPSWSLPGAAQTSGAVAFNLSLLPGLSLNGSDRHVTSLSLSLIAGLNGAVSGLEAATLLNLTRGDMRGTQIAGGGNAIGGHVIGLQVAGSFNFAGGDVDGFQVAGTANIAGDVRGGQIAGALNLARGPVRGFQIAGLMNLGGDLAGAQFGLLNVAARLDGAQVGLVNVAGASVGLQLGLVNVASGPEAEAFGLLSFVENGYNHLEFWLSDSTMATTGIKFGGRHMYTLLAVGYGYQRQDAWELAIGWGLHFNLGTRFYLDVDALFGSRWRQKEGVDTDPTPQDALMRLRASLGVRLFSKVSLFAGSGLTFAAAVLGEEPVAPLCCGRVVQEEDKVVSVGPALFAGLQF